MAGPGKHYDQWQKPATKKTHTVWLHLYGMSRIGKSIETGSKSVVPQSWEIGGKRGVTANGFGGFFLGWWNILELIVVMVVRLKILKTVDMYGAIEWTIGCVKYILNEA